MGRSTFPNTFDLCRSFLLLCFFPLLSAQDWLPNSNASLLYPYYTQIWFPEAVRNWSSFPSWKDTQSEMIDKKTLPYDVTLWLFLSGAGDLSDNCTLAVSWYESHKLQASSTASLGTELDEFNLQDLKFMHLAAPLWVDALAAFLSIDSDAASVELYPVVANLTNPIGDAVFNITRPAIEYKCISKSMAEAYPWKADGDCATTLASWNPPGLELLDLITDMQNAFTSLPDEHKNISIQTFFGWLEMQGFLDDSRIEKRKKECYQTVCSSLETSGNPDIAGIGMFISYIIEACLATFFILRSGWHNWNHRKTLFSETPNITTPARDFTKIMDAFLNTGVVLLLSLAVALAAVGSHELILYNGIVIHLVCHFTASAVIAVASLPHYGSHRHAAFWVCLIFSTLLSTIAMNVASQYDIQWNVSEDLLEAMAGSLGDPMQLLVFKIPSLQISIGASEFPGIKRTSKQQRRDPFTVAQCLLWGLLYYDGDIEGFITSYLPYSFYFHEIVYFGGILLFFFLMGLRRTRRLRLRSDWMRRNETSLIFWIRCVFSVVAWMNMLMGLACIALWRHFQSVAMGSYYTEAAVGYGQVLSLFLWAPVIASILYALTKNDEYQPISWPSRIGNVLKKSYRGITQRKYRVAPQNNIPLLPVSSTLTTQVPIHDGAGHMHDLPVLTAEASQTYHQDPRNRRVTTL